MRSSPSASPTSPASDVGRPGSPPMIALAAKVALAPLLVAQAVATRRRARVLPEAEGPREGELGSGHGSALRVLIAGDSSAAGVGVALQEQAVAGHLVRALHGATGRRIAWALRARSGLTTRAVHDLLRETPPFGADVVVVISGVNDVIDQVSTRRAVRDRAALGRLARRRARRAPRRLRAVAAGASLPAPARAPAPRDGQRRASSRCGPGALGGDARRCFACRLRPRPRSVGHGARRLSSRRAGLSRLRRGARGAHRGRGVAHQLTSRSGVAPILWIDRSAPANSSSCDRRRPVTARSAP